MNYSEEEKEAIEKLSSKKNDTTWYDTIRQIKREEIKDTVVTRQKYITAVLNLIQKQEKEIQKSRKKNNDLLSKLRNRIKQVNKLAKYSNYKKEFSNLNRKIEKQEKIIDRATEVLEEAKLSYFTKEDGGELIGQYRCFNKEDWKKYLKKEVEKNVKD